VTAPLVLQPIVDLATGEPVGYEALSRFTDPAGGPRRPDQVFAEAAELGLGVRLEQVAARTALRLLPHLPAGTYLSVNLSPPAVLDPATFDLLTGAPLHRLPRRTVAPTPAGRDEARAARSGGAGTRGRPPGRVRAELRGRPAGEAVLGRDEAAAGHRREPRRDPAAAVPRRPRARDRRGDAVAAQASVGSGALHVRLLDPLQRPDAAARLACSLGDVTLEPDPAALSVGCSSPEQGADAVAALARSGVRVADFSLGQPSLDEVFLSLTGRPAVEVPAQPSARVEEAQR
jgi:hypothetical protein